MAERKPISAFIICVNEEKHIADCIRSLDFCDEIILVDSFSKDRTVEIAQTFAPQVKVIQRPWPGYKKQKEFALEQVTHEWVVNLDADERVSPELRAEILEILAAPENADEVVGYYINRLVFYLNRWWRRGGWYPEYRLRLFKKSCVTWGGEEPHEKALVRGKSARLAGDIHHYTYENFDAQIDRLHHFSTLAAKQLDSRGVKPTIRSLIINPLWRSFKFFFVKRGYREGVAGFIVAVAEGYYTFLKYAKLWELHFNREVEKGKQ